MISYFETDCPGCSRRLRVRAAYVGLSIACNRCDRSFVAQPIPGRPFLEGRPHRPKDRPTGPGTVPSEIAPTLAVPDGKTSATDDADLAAKSCDRLAEAPPSRPALADGLREAERRAEKAARRRRKAEKLVADRDRLRREVGELTARLMAAEVESERRAEVASRGDVERLRLDRLCQELKLELERSVSGRELLQSSLEVAEAGRDAASRSLGEAASVWEAERLELLRRIDELRVGCKQAEVELDAARALLESERSARRQESEAARSREQALRAEIESVRRSAEFHAATVADLSREKSEVEGRFRRSVEDSEAAQACHAREIEVLTQALLDAQRQGQSRAVSLEVIQDQLRSIRIRQLGSALARRDERRRHRELIKATGRDFESERHSHDLQRVADRSKYEEATTRQSCEIAALQGQADQLRDEVLSLHRLLEDKDRELGKARGGADLIAAELAGLQQRFEELIRERDQSREQDAVPELTEDHGPVVSTEITPPDESTAAIVPITSGLAILRSLSEPTGISPPDLAAGVSTGAEGQSVDRWPLPEADNIDAARDQIALLSDLLRTARQANSRLSDRLARSMGVRKSEAHTSEVPTPPRPARAAEPDGTDLHVGMMRRAARLARRRKWGVD